MRIGGTRSGRGSQLVLATGVWLAALAAAANAQFFGSTQSFDSSFTLRPPRDVPSAPPAPAQSLIPPSGNVAPSAAPKGPLLQSLPASPGAAQAHAAVSVPRLVKEDKGAAPTFVLPPGAYVVSVGFGLANVTKAVQVRAETMKDVFEIPAGGLRIEGRVGDARIPQGQISFDLYKGSQFEPGDKRPIASAIMTGDIVLLPEGAYHIVSNYGDANATVRSDIRVEVGKLTDATINHRAAIITPSPILRSEPERSFGRIFVPSRFHTSGGMLPERRSVRIRPVGSRGPGIGTSSGVGAVVAPSSGSE